MLEVDCEDEDPDLWRDEFGCMWMRSALNPRKWYLLGTGLDVDIIWEELGWDSWRATWGEAASLVLRDGCGVGELARTVQNCAADRGDL